MIAPRLLGVYINADEIEKNIKAGDALDFSEFAVIPDAAQFLDFLKKHPVLKKSSIADEVIAKISLSGSKLYLNGVVFDSYLASAISDYIRHQLNKHSLDLLADAIITSDRAFIFDNSGIPGGHVWLAEITNSRELEIQSSELPNWFNDAVLKKFGIQPADLL